MSMCPTTRSCFFEHSVQGCCLGVWVKQATTRQVLVRLYCEKRATALASPPLAVLLSVSFLMLVLSFLACSVLCQLPVLSRVLCLERQGEHHGFKFGTFRLWAWVQDLSASLGI